MTHPQKIIRADVTRVDKPWGHEPDGRPRIATSATSCTSTRASRYRSNSTCKKDESQLLVRGAIDIELGGADGKLETFRMTAGDNLHIPPGTRHRITAVEDTEIFEVSTAEMNDIVRLEDKYGRAGA